MTSSEEGKAGSSWGASGTPAAYLSGRSFVISKGIPGLSAPAHTLEVARAKGAQTAEEQHCFLKCRLLAGL